jgi:SAM-dependent methyltransferase
METDHYIQSAEVYDILSAPHWQARRESVRSALHGVQDLSEPILDVGAGTGTGLRIIADAVPHAMIFALEPSASMRVGLMTKVLLDEELKRRVTVEACSIQEATLPNKLSAALVCGCIGYLDREERLDMWRTLADRIVPEGLVLADVMMLDRPQAVPSTKVTAVRVGGLQYEMWVAGTPGNDDIMLWDMGCRVLRDEQVVRSFHVIREWHTFGIGQLLEEAAAFGFRGEVVKDSPVPAVILKLS